METYFFKYVFLLYENPKPITEHTFTV